MIEWVKNSGWQSPDAPPGEVVKAAGFAVILASAMTALLPVGNFDRGPQIVGGLMIAVGLIETVANFLRTTGRRAAIMAGVVSLVAGILIFARPETNFVTTVYVVIGWLAIRGLLLLLSAVETTGSLKRATLIVGMTDLILAGIVFAGLTASTLVIALFGPTAPIIADFAWVMAISFVGAGLLLVRIGSGQNAA